MTVLYYILPLAYCIIYKREATLTYTVDLHETLKLLMCLSTNASWLYVLSIHKSIYIVMTACGIVIMKLTGERIDL